MENAKRRINLEIALVIFAFWLPQMAGSLDAFLRTNSSIAAPHTTLYLVYSLSTRLGACLILVFLMSVSGKRLEEFGLVPIRVRDVVLGIGLLFVFIALTAGYMRITTTLHTGGFSTQRRSYTEPTSFNVLTMLVGVLYEELLCRSFLQTRLKDLGWANASIVAFTATLFAVPHIYQGPGVIPIVFAHGILLGAVFMRFKAIGPSLLTHWFYDLTIILFPVVWRVLIGRA